MTNKDVLRLMLNNINLLSTSLCNLASKMYFKEFITLEEYFNIKNYILNNKPSITSRLYVKHNLDKNLGYYWPKKDVNSRVRWLKYHIKICKS